MLSNRSVWWNPGSKNILCRRTGQQLLLGAYSALERQVGMGTVQMLSRHEMLDVVVIDGKARGIIARNLITGELETLSVMQYYYALVDTETYFI